MEWLTGAVVVCHSRFERACRSHLQGQDILTLEDAMKTVHKRWLKPSDMAKHPTGVKTSTTQQQNPKILQ